MHHILREPWFQPNDVPHFILPMPGLLWMPPVSMELIVLVLDYVKNITLLRVIPTMTFIHFLTGKF